MFVESSTLRAVKPAPVAVISQRARALAREGRSIVSLAVGEPDFDTPDEVKEAAHRAIREGKTKYTDVDGTPELKAAICAKIARDSGLSFEPAEINVSPGSKPVIFNAFLATLEVGDEVVIPAPYWISYPDMTRLAGATPVAVQTRPENDFKITPEELEAALTGRSRWLILNSPGNPSGAVYSRAELAALAEVVRRYPRLWVLSDDIYEHLIYDGVQMTSWLQVAPDLRERTLTMSGPSKSHAMTGWRVGYGAGPAPLIKAMAKVMTQSTANACSIAQWAALEAIAGPLSRVADRVERFARRRDLCLERLARLPELPCRKPQGAFYLFADVSTLIGGRLGEAALTTDEDVARTLLEAEGVAAVPGSAFGTPGYLRLSYAADEAVLHEAFDRLERFVAAVRAG
jgi:aspartate aminotransferase